MKIFPQQAHRSSAFGPPTCTAAALFPRLPLCVCAYVRVCVCGQRPSRGQVWEGEEKERERERERKRAAFA